MARNALGLIETVGLVGAIEAADAAAKAAAVLLTKAEVTPGALVTVHIEGELGAVQAAVEAGVNACQRVGQLLSYVIIPRPDPNLDTVLDTPSNLYIPEGPFCATAPESKGEKTDLGTRSAAPRETKPRLPRPRRTPSVPGGDYESMTVQALRRLARRRGDLAISGRDIARADKETLIRLLKKADTDT